MTSIRKCSHCKLPGHNIRTCPSKNTPSQETVVSVTPSLTCPICYCDIESKNSATTPCGHGFCFECIAHALQENTNCPLCREQLAPPNEKVYTRSEHIHEVDNAFHEGNHEGYSEGYNEGYNEGRTSAGLFSHEFIQRVREEYERKMEARELAWRDQKAADIQKSYERGIMEGKKLDRTNMLIAKVRSQETKIKTLSDELSRLRSAHASALTKVVSLVDNSIEYSI